jgi:proteic killer suppression protein
VTHPQCDGLAARRHRPRLNSLLYSALPFPRAELYFNNAPRYYLIMPIKSFKCTDTESLFKRQRIKRFTNIESVARRKLEQLDWAGVLDDMRVPPGNRLEALKHDRAGQHSIRINDQFRVCFVWTAEGPKDVEIVDYH